MGKNENDRYKDLRILGFILIFLIVCGIILEINASNDGCGYGDGGDLGCLGYGFAWLGCLFFVGLTILGAIITYFSKIKKSEVEIEGHTPEDEGTISVYIYVVPMIVLFGYLMVMMKTT